MKKEQQTVGPFVDNPTVRFWVAHLQRLLTFGEFSLPVTTDVTRKTTDIEYHSIIQRLGEIRAWRYIPLFWSKENWLFQIYHIIQIALIFWPLAVWPDRWFGWLLTGLFFGIGEEWQQWRNWDWRVLMLPDRILDTLFRTGGAVALFGVSRLLL